ncbi:sensor domain-containing protein [Nocardioides sp. zg-ZUI104]|uniref:sensor histidine kinase n=1 Tax=Nocardioides faecalis TaxID=2803858 RepID=UPI001BCC9AA2|nr:sensor domain-containing protein [Nocardioides faecalis]MBS4751691.1 sensor domain-containing protein [Nocardioides faecalis]
MSQVLTSAAVPAPAATSYDDRDRGPQRGVRRVLLESGYALSAFPIALVAFVLVVIDLSLGASLAVLVVGVLLLSVGVMVARGFARFERLRVQGMLGRRAATPRYVCAEPGAGFWRRMLTPLRDAQSWLDVAWALAGVVTGTLAFTVTVTWWGVVLGGLTYWFWQQWLPEDGEGLAQLIGLGEGAVAESLLQLGLGVVALVTLPWAVRAVSNLHAGLAWALLSSRADLQGRVTQVEQSRDSAHRAEAESLRRLERDIHDGPQQRLIRLGMDLGRARVQLAQDPTRAARTLDEAVAQARAAVEELRALSRGIAPPLLVDRGLAAAVGEMAAGQPIPVGVHTELPGDLPAAAETAAYFVVAEALTNVVKHARATRADVAVVVVDGRLEVTVSDDGRGGATTTPGHGLHGLAERLRGVDGDLEVLSPEGGPTRVRARVPLG